MRLGVANQRVAVRTMHLPLIEDPEELDTAVRFQAQDELPMPLDEAVLDYQVVSREKDEEGHRQMDVVVVAARRDMLRRCDRGLARGRVEAGRDRPLRLRDDPRPRRAR